MATGTYTFTYTAVVSPVDTSSVISTFTQSTFVSKVSETPGTYTFTYNGSNWQLDGTNVTMSQYGITTKGTETSGTTITIYYTSNSWYVGSASVSSRHGSLSSVSSSPTACGGSSFSGLLPISATSSTLRPRPRSASG